ncbi:MAG TPA: TetR family transcriptional regulator [Streptosporangiaceae bacterium]|nr:TetR family transcriptional regulator [Streptosporangiaceae bacterium]
MIVRDRESLLDGVAEVLVANLSASMAEVARAAGIGRTTLHKHYATRDDLLRAVGHRAIEKWEQALDKVPDDDRDGESDGGLLAMATAMVPIGPQLAFLWRTPALGQVPELIKRAIAVEDRCQAVLLRAQRLGVIKATVPEWWLLDTYLSMIYSASLAVSSGKLAPLDAPRLAIATLLHGIGET